MRFILVALNLLLLTLFACLVETPPGQPGGDRPARGRQLFERLGCTACHNMDGTESAGPSLHDVGLRMTREEIRRQLVSPYRGRSVYVSYRDGRSETLFLVEETVQSLKVRREGAGEVQVLMKKDLEEFQIIPSQMPSNLVESLSPDDLDTLVNFLTRQRKRLPDVPR